jgi:cobyrinic acid a,c-diamide synthase
MKKTQGILVAGTRSGCGKTSVCLALTAALARRGLVVQGCKIGPDFIDPGHHQAFSARPSYNLDSWMHGPRGMLRNLARALRLPPRPDVLIVEGVMGLFDGAGRAGTAAPAASTAEAAFLLDLPVLLLLDASGMGQSVTALAEGFINHPPKPDILGLVCTGVGGAGHQALLREALRDLPLLGLLPKKGAPELPSRHLGLVTADELSLSPERKTRSADWIEEHLDVGELLRSMPPVRKFPEGETPLPLPRPGTIAIARDRAFCFLYPELPAMLEEAGARVVFFSPLEDAGLPEADVVYLPGGYPELFARRLAENLSMRGALRSFAASGGTVYGECGGYIYLMEEVRVENTAWPMSGCLPMRCVLGGEHAALGYRRVRPAGASPLAPEGETADLSGRGHEFHYARVADREERPDLTPLWRIADGSGRDLGREGAVLKRAAGSWVHLAPSGAWPLWRNLAGHAGAAP